MEGPVPTKVLWVEDHPRIGELLTGIASAVARIRPSIDLVLARTLQDAEQKLRREGFDLVIIDLLLPDSADEDVTVTRLANMGSARLAVVSASDRRQAVVDGLVKAGVNCAPLAIGKETLQFSDFLDAPEMFAAFVRRFFGDDETAIA